MSRPRMIFIIGSGDVYYKKHYPYFHGDSIARKRKFVKGFWGRLVSKDNKSV